MTQEEYRDDLLEKISRATTIVTDLESCQGFQFVVEDVEKGLKQLDNNWHLIPEGDDWVHKMKEMRLTKMASGYIVNLLNIYKSDIDRMQTELNKIENPETEINKDFDTGAMPNG